MMGSREALVRKSSRWRGTELEGGGGVFSLAAAMLRDDFGALDDFPDDVANTVSNYCYRWILLRSEPALPRIIVQPPKMMDAHQDEIAWRLDCFPEELARLRSIRRSNGERAFSHACALFVDKYKYGIADADRKSGLRRKIERIFKRTGEMRELYGLMKTGSDSAARILSSTGTM